MATKLSVNLNKVATLRNTRTTGIPDVGRCARICLDAGADGITLHPRPDQRHVRGGDVEEIARIVSGYPAAELNIEGNPMHNLVAHAEAVRPAQCTLVPDDPSQATSDHGWNLTADSERLRPIVARLQALGCRVSLFMDAVPGAIGRARDIGADRVELYTGPFAAAFARGARGDLLGAFRAAALAAQGAGLGVNAGHDLDRSNLPVFLREVPGVLEVSIGHALIADALELGLAETVRRYRGIARGS
jgi:pyridoxine 5-phosphate synthase